MIASAASSCRVSLAQLNSSEDYSRNLDVISKAVSAAHSMHVDLMLLPENCCLMANQKDMLRFSQRDSPSVLRELCALAKSHALWIVVGSLPTASEVDSHYLARLYVIDSNGEVVGTYDKRHLFDLRVSADEVYFESQYVLPGDQIKVVPTPWGGLGTSICYDLRFPEHYRTMLNHSASLLVVPSAFTYHTGAKHWDILLRARAIENQCYVLAANQTGIHYGGRRTYGHSILVGPDGETVAHCMETTQNLVAEIDLQALIQLRESFPVLAHRKIDDH